MFTGIIQNTGQIQSLKKARGGNHIKILCKLPMRALREIKIGDSVAIDGCCLTVVQKKGKSLSFDVSMETFRKTKISQYMRGERVNLELPLKLSDRVGGHFVLGHVDGVGRIETIKKQRDEVTMTLSTPKSLAPYLIEKGSLTIDGVSLTISLAGRNRLKVYIIPHTWKVTSLSSKKDGDPVNLEGDVLGKYVRRLISLA